MVSISVIRPPRSARPARGPGRGGPRAGRCAALTSGDKTAIKASLEEVSSLLVGLSPAIYTAKLSQLKAAAEELDCVAKSSGAGGGDCGIALVFNAEDKQILLQRWQLAGIELLHQEKMGKYESES